MNVIFKERIGNSGTQFFCMPCLLRLLVHACTTMVKKRAPRDTFFRNYEPNHNPETSLSCHANLFPITFNSFLYATILVHHIWCPSKGYLVHDRNVHMNLTIICIKLFQYFSILFSIKHFL